MTDDEDLLPPGTRVGAYVIEGLLGRGGMGVVYRARDPELDRPVAVKVLAPWLAGNRQLVERMQREARAMARIDHPNLVAVYATGEVAGTRYLAMQLVEGCTLQDLLEKEGPLPVARALAIARGVADALACAHEAGIIHRDIKPDNVLLDPSGRVRVADFGLARPLAASDLTAPDSFVGTPRYSAPEQWLGGELDGRTDLYALGVVLFEMLGGRPPFDAATTPVLLRQVLEEPPPDLASLNHSVPRPVQDLVERLLEKEPDFRPSSAGEVSAALETLREGGVPPAPAPPVSGPRKAPPSRNVLEPRPSPPAPALRWPLVVLGFLVVVGFLWGGVAWFRGGSAGGPLVACVLDFENPRKSEELDWMRVGAPDLLTTSLSRYPFLRLLGRDALDVPYRKAAGGEAAAEAARRLGAEALITGSCLEPEAGQVVLDVKAQDLEDGSVLAAVQVRAAAEPAPLLAALDEVAAGLARPLGRRYEASRPGRSLGPEAFAASGGLAGQLFARVELPPQPSGGGGGTGKQFSLGSGVKDSEVGGKPEGSSPRLPPPAVRPTPGDESGSASPGRDGTGTPAAGPERLRALALYYRAVELEQDHGSEPGTPERCRALLREALEAEPGLVPARQALERLK